MTEITEETIVDVVNFILENGQHDGEHHKQWVLDQVVRMLAQNDYADTIKAAFGEEDDEDGTGYWDVGIPP